MKIFKYKIIRVLISIILLCIIFYKIDWASLVHILGSAQWIFIFFASLLAISGSFLSTLRWKQILKIYIIQIETTSLFILCIISSFLSNFLPTSFGGDVYRYFILAKQFPLKKKEILSSLLGDRGVGLFAFIVLNVALLPVYYKIVLNSYPFIVIESVILTMLTVVSVLFFFNKKIILFIKSRGVKSAFLQKALGLLETISKIDFSLASSTALIFSVLFVFDVGLSFFFIFTSLHVNIPFFYIVFIVTITNIASVFPVSINSIGVTEGLNVFLLGFIGVSPETALAVSLVARAAGLVTTAISGGIPYAFHTVDFKKMPRNQELPL